MFLNFVANLFHEFVGDLGSFVRPGGMRGAITIRRIRRRRAGVWDFSVLQLYPVGSSSARGLARSAVLAQKSPSNDGPGHFFRFFGLPNNALKFASKK